jgi:hypothetical protein
MSKLATKPQVLTVKGVKAAARRAYKARTLTAQHRSPRDRQCFYALGCYRCPVGAAMTDATLKSLIAHKTHRATFTANSMAFDYLVDEKLVECRGKDEQDAIYEIQEAHDTWAKKARVNARRPGAKKARTAFLKLIAA